MLVKVCESQTAIEKLRETADCFILLTNVPCENRKGLEILKIYKEQDSIERKFGFLKDPLVVNEMVRNMGFILVENGTFL